MRVPAALEHRREQHSGPLHGCASAPEWDTRGGVTPSHHQSVSKGCGNCMGNPMIGIQYMTRGGAGGGLYRVYFLCHKFCAKVLVRSLLDVFKARVCVRLCLCSFVRCQRISHGSRRSAEVVVPHLQWSGGIQWGADKRAGGCTRMVLREIPATVHCFSRATVARPAEFVRSFLRNGTGLVAPEFVDSDFCGHRITPAPPLPRPPGTLASGRRKMSHKTHDCTQADTTSSCSLGVDGVRPHE